MKKRLFIAKSEWFGRRKYTWWGLSIKTWQWLVYSLFMVTTIITSSSTYLIQATNGYSQYFGMFVIFIFVLDIAYAMYVLYNDKIDERERLHEAISERNALWWVIVVLSLWIIYQYYFNMSEWIQAVDPVIIIALFIGLSIKALANYKLGKNN